MTWLALVGILAIDLPYQPWGFNYDRDSKFRLIEEYWEAEWKTVEEDFAEMRALGANVVRIHLQVAKFMLGPDEPNLAALRQLKKLAALAEREKLGLDITGLGSYRAGDVPKWYDTLPEAARWAAQARFWEAVAGTVADSPAVFCYDLMNEPVVPSKPVKTWLSPVVLAGLSFVQYLTRNLAGRPRDEVVRQWASLQIAAIRKKDTRHPITVGMLPGGFGGFTPKEIAPVLDFISVHLYPKSKDLAAVRRHLKLADVGKPIVIEETFPMECTMAEMEAFLVEAREKAAGVISFYWGNPDDPPLLRDWLKVFKKLKPGSDGSARRERPSGGSRAPETEK